MKKVTLILCCFIASAGLMQAQNGDLPAAYQNGTSTPVTESILVDSGTILFDPDDLLIPLTGIYRPHENNMAQDLIYDSGPYINESGPPELSIVENMSMGMTTYGFGVQIDNTNSIADEVVLTED